MCEVGTVLAVTTLVIGAASAATSYAAQSAQASAQKKQQANLSELEKQRFLAEAGQIRQKQALEAEVSAQQQSQVQKEAAKQRSTATVAAGEAGVTGLSVDTLLSDYAAQEAAFKQQSNRQTQINSLYTTQQLEASRLGTQFNLARINEPINRPSALTLALGIGSAGVDAANTYKKFHPDWGNK